MCSDWGTEPSDCRCAGAEIGSNGPCSLEGEVVVSVPVHGRCGSLERTGTAGDDVPLIQILHPSCPSLTAHSPSSPSSPPLPSPLFLRGSTWRPTAPSESCCWQTDTRASCPRTTAPLCLWRPNSPRAATPSPSLASCRSGIPWQGRARLISHQTTPGFSTWTRRIFWGWLTQAWSVLSSRWRSDGKWLPILFFSGLNLRTWLLCKWLEYFFSFPWKYWSIYLLILFIYCLY